MDEVKKPSRLAAVVVHRDTSELEQWQEFHLAAAMVSGPLGKAVLNALARISDDVTGRAVSDG